MDLLWDQVEKTKGTSGTYPFAYAPDGLLSNTTNMKTTFTNNGDAMPGTKLKTVHS